MARALMQSVMSLTIMLLMVAAVAAAASREESTIESEDSVMVANEGRSLKACPSGQGLFKRNCYCKPGYGWNRRVRKCFYCPSGSYKPGYNFDSCKRCGSKYLVDEPIRSKCQPHCQETDDFSTTYWKGYVAVAYPTHYYDWQGSGRRNWDKYWSAAEVCERLSEVGYPNYVPAKVSDSESERGDVNTLARFHFTCYPKNWYYWTRKSWNDNSPNTFGQCDRTRISNGFGQQFSGKRCYPSSGSSWKYPVICSKGCDKWCHSCDESGHCTECEPGYTKNRRSGFKCFKDPSPPKDN